MPKTLLALALLWLASSPVSASTMVTSADDHLAGPAGGAMAAGADPLVTDTVRPILASDGAVRADHGIDLALGTALGTVQADPLDRLILPRAQPGFAFPLASALGLIMLGLGGTIALVRRRRLALWFAGGAQPSSGRVSGSGGRSRRRSGRRRR